MTTKPQDDRRERLAVTVEEACDMLGIGRSTGYVAARDGSIPTIRVGRRILVPLAALERMLNGETG